MTTPPTRKLGIVTPLKGRVIVLPDEPEAVTDSGLIIPDTAKEAPTTGLVTHVSGDKEDVFEVGQRVMFVKNAGVELQMGKEHFLMREDDIYAIVK